VLRPDKGPQCADFQAGSKLLEDIGPGQRDPEIACHPGDRRRLPSDIVRQLFDFNQLSEAERLSEIKRLAEAGRGSEIKMRSEAEQPPKRPRIAATGIRLIGAIFCEDEVNLTDLDLPYPLVLDHALFRSGIRGQNFHTRGDLSLEGSFVFRNLALSRSKIEGSLLAQHGFLENVGLVETEARGGVYFDNSLLEGKSILDSVTTAGDISFHNAAMAQAQLSKSTIHGRLDFSYSEARCGYTVRASEIDEVWATDLGFGSFHAIPDTESRQAPSPGAERAPPPVLLVIRYGWSRTNGKDFYKRLLQNASIKNKTDEPQSCGSGESESELLLSDVRARSFCLRFFFWLSSPDSKLRPLSAISLRDLKIAGSMNLNIWPLPPGAKKTTSVSKSVGDKSASDEIAERHILRIAGLSVGVLFFDFSDDGRPYVTSVDRLQIDRVHSSAGFECGEELTRADSRPPDVAQVSDWLTKNKSRSLQPISAFIRAFENAGADSTSLKVTKAQIEFDRTLSALNATVWANKTSASFFWDEGPRVLWDYLRIAGGWVLGLIADHGFRPVKVLLPAFVILVGFWLLLRFGLGIVAFLPDKQTELRPIGFTFVFDRLIPIYRLRDENYQIVRFYQRGTGAGQEKSDYFGCKNVCVPASPKMAHKAGICLDILKALGIVLAVFLVAALNALIAR
jgi:hypothetical protein